MERKRRRRRKSRNPRLFLQARGKKGAPRWTEEKLKVLYDEWMDGASKAALGRKYDVSQQRIYTLLHHYEAILALKEARRLRKQST